MKITWDKEINFLVSTVKRLAGTPATPLTADENLNWDKVVRIASGQGISLLLYSALTAQEDVVPPQNVKSVLKQQFLTNLNQNIARTTQLIRALTLLQSHKIGALPFKGPVLGELAYHDLGLRVFSDVDILIQSRDFLRAHDLLRENGWKPSTILSGKIRKVWIHSRRDLEFTHSQIVMDCHQQLTQGPRFLSPESHIWSSTQEVVLLNKKFVSISPEYTVISICLNGTKDQWATIKPITDLFLFLRHTPQLDWDVLMERAGLMGVQNIILLGLSLCRRLYGCDIPDRIWQKRALKQLIPRHTHQILNRVFAKKPDYRMFYRFLFMFNLLDSWKFRLAYLGHFMFSPTPRDFSLIPLPRALHPLYYFIRPVRVGLSSLFMAIKTLIQEPWENNTYQNGD
jgi:hypothetical protein